MTPYGSKNKYKAQKTKYKGKTYDSKKEAEYAEILDKLKDQGKITEWERQVRFPLPNLDGLWKSWYSADFVVQTLDGREHIVEVKGVLTDANKIKYAFVQHIYKRPIHIVRTTGLEKMNISWLSCTDCPDIYDLPTGGN